MSNDNELVLNDYIENVFCPTGPGGGVDPTCPAGGGKIQWVKDPDYKRSRIIMVRADQVIGTHDEGFSKESSDKHSSNLARSISKSNKVQALVVTKTSDGRYKVIDGKHRYQALTQFLGVQDIGVQIVD